MRVTASLPAAAAIAGFAAAPAPAQTLFRPVATVNEVAITGFDLAQRAQTLVLLDYARLRQLVDEKLKLEAASRTGIEVSPETLETGVQAFARSSRSSRSARSARSAGMASDAFRGLLSRQGASNCAPQDMARAEVGCAQVVRARFSGQPQPGAAEVETKLAMLDGQADTEARVLEIGLPPEEEGRSPRQTRALAEQLHAEIGAGGDFEAAVARHSRSPGAAAGGQVGWASTGRMPADLRQALRALPVDGVSQPLPVSGSLTILKVIGKRRTGAPPVANHATRAAVRTRLADRRSNDMAEGLLQELRRSAPIELR